MTESDLKPGASLYYCDLPLSMFFKMNKIGNVLLYIKRVTIVSVIKKKNKKFSVRQKNTSGYIETVTSDLGRYYYSMEHFFDRVTAIQNDGIAVVTKKMKEFENEYEDIVLSKRYISELKENVKRNLGIEKIDE